MCFVLESLAVLAEFLQTFNPSACHPSMKHAGYTSFVLATPQTLSFPILCDKGQ